MLTGDTVVMPLPIERLQREHQPAHSALHRYEVELRKAVADAGVDDVGNAVMETGIQHVAK